MILFEIKFLIAQEDKKKRENMSIRKNMRRKQREKNVSIVAKI